MTSPLDDNQVQMMLAWSLAVHLRAELGVNDWDILHSTHNLHYGLNVASRTGSGGVAILYHPKSSIHVFGKSGAHDSMPSAWLGLLNGVPARAIAVSIRQHPLIADLRDGPESARAGERSAAYNVLAALMRLSVQRGYGWRCDLPNTGWGVDHALVRPYLAFTRIKQKDASDAPQLAYPDWYGQISDWSFVRSSDGPVCAVDPEHWIMFPDGMRWSLNYVPQATPWKVALAVANKTGPEVTERQQIPGLQPFLTRTLDDHDLFTHESLGGRVLDHELYGPTPVLKGEPRRQLEKASGLQIPAHALVLRQIEPSRLHDVRDHPDYTDSGNQSLDLLIAWNAFQRDGHHRPGGMVLVLRRDQDIAIAIPALHLANNLGAHNPSVLVTDPGLSGPEHAFGWDLRRLE